MALLDMLKKKHPGKSDEKLLRRFGGNFLGGNFAVRFINGQFWKEPEHTRDQIIKTTAQVLGITPDEATVIFPEVVSTEYPIDHSYTSGRNLEKRGPNKYVFRMSRIMTY